MSENWEITPTCGLSREDQATFQGIRNAIFIFGGLDLPNKRSDGDLTVKTKGWEEQTLGDHQQLMDLSVRENVREPLLFDGKKDGFLLAFPLAT